MALAAGTRLGPYEVQSAIGVGGMGEVYRARDTKLGRDVALKVLPESLAKNPDRPARQRPVPVPSFEKERGQVPLADGDEITIGPAVFLFRIVRASRSTVTDGLRRSRPPRK